MAIEGMDAELVAALNAVKDEGPIGETVDLSQSPSDRLALALIPEQYAASHNVLPLSVADGVLTLACADGDDGRLLREVEVLSRCSVRALVAPANEIQDSIRERYRVLDQVDEHVKLYSERMVVESIQAPLAALESVTEASPVVQIVNLLIAQGLRDRASDIHIEPQQKELRIRFRIDGILTDTLSLPKTMAPALASRLKVMADMDIVDRHRAQDGQIRTRVENRAIDIRVSTAETIWGEKVVLRLLDQGRTVLKLDQLGLSGSGYRQLGRLLQSPYGMVVVSGPTGSGKTTSLYAAITELDPIAQNIVTIEEPVEYTFDNINQIQVRRVANLTFANGLRAVLRQDPDVILIGEIRDQETAEIAVQSSLTGHLVLSSLHATDAAGVIQRFIEMGIEGYLVSSSLIGVVAQRLVRRICSYCEVTYRPSVPELLLWNEFGGGDHVFRRGRGCNYCAGTGYRGRMGVFEVLPIGDGIKRLISEKASAQQIRQLAVQEGMTTLRGAGIEKVADDVTTLSEVMRCVWVN